LRPYGQHADEQRERRKGGSFFDDGPNHDPFLPTGQNGNDVLILFFCQAWVVGQFELRQAAIGLVFCSTARPASDLLLLKWVADFDPAVYNEGVGREPFWTPNELLD
jgi:hypothetical protein